MISSMEAELAHAHVCTHIVTGLSHCTETHDRRALSRPK